jgi:hypothetical protein
MLEAFVKVKLWRRFLNVRSICIGKQSEMVPRF